jgi:hypothetical protein
MQKKFPDIIQTIYDLLFVLSLPINVIIQIIYNVFEDKNYSIDQYIILESDYNSNVKKLEDNQVTTIPQSAHAVEAIMYKNEQYFVKKPENNAWRNLLTRRVPEEIREFIGVELTRNVLKLNENLEYANNIVLPEIKFVKNPKGEIIKILSKSVCQESQGIPLTQVLSALNSGTMPEAFKEFTKETLRRLLPTIYKIHAIDAIIGNVDRHNNNIMLIRDEVGNFKIGIIDFGLTLHTPKRSNFRVHRTAARALGYWSFDNDKMIHEDALNIQRAAEISDIDFQKAYNDILSQTRDQIDIAKDNVVGFLKSSNLRDKVEDIISINKQDCLQLL